MVKYNCRHDAGCCCWRYKELHLFDDESSRRRATVMNATAWRRREWTTHSITYWLAEQLSTEQLVNAQLLMQPQCTGNLANCEHCCVMRGLAVYAATFIVRQHTDKRYWYSNFFSAEGGPIWTKFRRLLRTGTGPPSTEKNDVMSIFKMADLSHLGF